MKYEMLTFVHIFPSCSQDSCAVIAVMADVVKQPKEVMPTLTSVYYRQDNAACYHCGATITCGLVLHDQVSIKRLDFSDPQGGKGPCDRKAATIKSHMRIHFELRQRHRDTRPNERRNFVFWWSATLTLMYNECFPLIKVKISSRDPPFMSPLIKHLCNLRNKSMKRYGFLIDTTLQERINNLIREFVKSAMKLLNIEMVPRVGGTQSTR